MLVKGVQFAKEGLDLGLSQPQAHLSEHLAKLGLIDDPVLIRIDALEHLDEAFQEGLLLAKVEPKHHLLELAECKTNRLLRSPNKVSPCSFLLSSLLLL